MRLQDLARKQGRNLIISTPLDIGSQEESFHNPFERHQFQWSKGYLHCLQDAFFIPNRKSILCYSGEDANRVRRRFMRRKRSTIFRECLPHLAAGHEQIKRLLHILFPKKG